MKRGRSVFFIAAVLLLGGAFLYKLKLSPSPQTQIQAQVRIQAAGKKVLSPEEEGSASEPTATVLSLKKMAGILFQATVAGEKMESLLRTLKNSQQEPFLVHDKNEDTGEMILVRTKSPLPGTRYFHAQYFTDESQQTFAQHISFELRASPQAMAQAIQTVQETFPNLNKPSYETSDFVQWDLEDGYVVWIKRLGPEDIQANPFNFYSQDDIGTIRVAVELAPEDE
ncbi:MAG: hypothetical protein ACXVB4_15495 [Pseudobdellovibrionaceae bacterium]